MMFCKLKYTTGKPLEIETRLLLAFQQGWLSFYPNKQIYKGYINFISGVSTCFFRIKGMIITIETRPVILHKKGIKISIERFYLFFRIKDMIITTEAWPVILHIKSIKISIECFHLCFRVKDMVITIKVRPVILHIKGLKISIECSIMIGVW